MYPLVYAVDIQKPHVPRNESGYVVINSHLIYNHLI